MKIDGADFFVRVVKFPVTTPGGMVMPNDDGTYSIYLNSELNWERQVEAYRHEVGHIENDDFYNDKSIEEIEKL